jgi:hypothetical protein
MTLPRATAVIVTYHSRDMIERTAGAMKRSHDKGLAECVVVDNDSRDGTVEYLRAQHSWITVIESDANIGFGRGCNLGAREARTPYLLFINPDADLEPEALANLLEFLEHRPKAGLAAPAIVAPDGELQETGALPTPWRVLRAAAGRAIPRKIQPGEQAFPVEWICGAAVLIRRSLFESLGGFDPRFFLYFEETDLCKRAREQGAEIWAVGEAVANHLDGAVARRTGRDLYLGCIAQHYFESRYYYLAKHHGRLAAIATEVGELIILAMRAVPRFLRGRSNESLHIRLGSPICREPAAVSI